MQRPLPPLFAAGGVENGSAAAHRATADLTLSRDAAGQNGDQGGVQAVRAERQVTCHNAGATVAHRHLRAQTLIIDNVGPSLTQPSRRNRGHLSIMAAGASSFMALGTSSFMAAGASSFIAVSASSSMAAGACT